MTSYMQHYVYLLFSLYNNFPVLKIQDEMVKSRVM